LPWYSEEWSRGILLGLNADPNTGYRATIWFEYTRALFNEIREGSLLAVRNFSDRPRSANGTDAEERDPTYEEFSILQIDQVHPWHYAIQGSGDQGYPAFNVAAAESARQDWTNWDEQNRDDVTRIRCEAIPLRLALMRPQASREDFPVTFADRSKPMPGYEARVLRPEMTERILNQTLVAERCVDLGTHLVQPDVTVRVSVPEMLRLHFGVFGFTGAGKSNLVSTLVRRCLNRPGSTDGRAVYKVVLFDLMDEYTGLLIDQLAEHRYSQLVICGRETVDRNLLAACAAVATNAGAAETAQTVREAAGTWSARIVLPAQLRDVRDNYIRPLSRLIKDQKVKFSEPLSQQGQVYDVPVEGTLNRLGTRAFGNSADQTRDTISGLRDRLSALDARARSASGPDRDAALDEMIAAVEGVLPSAGTTATGKLEALISALRSQKGSRGALDRNIATWPRRLAGLLNWDAEKRGGRYVPSLTVVIGENEQAIAGFAGGDRGLVEEVFAQRREESLLYPLVSFIFDEADVFISQNERDPGNIVDQATLLARRGRKFGLGLGIATQRVRYLNTTIMAQPHTYFISKLPRQSDRQAIAEAFAISEESLEQSFAFTPGQWLVASHDATGLKGAPFPVQLPNANDAVRDWLQQFNRDQTD